MRVAELLEILARYNNNGFGDFEVVLDTHDGQGLYSIGHTYNDLTDEFTVLDITFQDIGHGSADQEG